MEYKPEFYVRWYLTPLWAISALYYSENLIKNLQDGPNLENVILYSAGAVANTMLTSASVYDGIDKIKKIYKDKISKLFEVNPNNCNI